MVKDIQYTMNEAPALGVPTYIAQGIYMLRMPLPFALDHVNCWLVEDDDSWTIIDTGLGSQDCLDIWDTVLNDLLKDKPVTQIILTHYHPDHVGLSGDLATRTRAPVYMSRTEWLTANMLFHDKAGHLGVKMIDLFHAHGLPDEMFAQMSGKNNIYLDRVSSLPDGYTRIRHNDVIEMAGSSWYCREGQGHSPEHISLFNSDGKILFAGDHILPKITPNIPMPVQEISANPIADYIDSLEKFKDIDNDVLVLPSHRLPFKGVRTRIDQLIEHHNDRLQTLLEACQQPVSVFDILPVLFKRELDLNQMKFAMLEALSHMVFLEQEGKLIKTQDKGKYYWREKSFG